MVSDRREVARQCRRMMVAASYTAGHELIASLRFVDDDAIHALNLTYRKKDKPTDVLAFAQQDADTSAGVVGILGDVFVSVPTALRQAKQKTRRGLMVEVLFLSAHGICHLLGYDHPTAAKEQLMNARMAQLLAEAARRGKIAAA